MHYIAKTQLIQIACVYGLCYQVSGCIHSHSEQWLPEDENDQQKMNRQREGCGITKKDATCNLSNRKSLFKMSCCFQLRTENLNRKQPCFPWGPSFLVVIVSNYLFVFCFCFSDSTTVQWYFIVGPSLALAVLAFIVLYLRKRRINGIYMSLYKFFCILNASSQWTTLFCSQR